ncbi:MAG: alpha/beta hydrolase [Candidatus Marinimicrobia bacterium]|jgi:pimeloyl-ACP methyl ester carboxylesterase|nr:alpha/beta hydrolase [Candidatus Neomarinimicrobiota bacterium]
MSVPEMIFGEEKQISLQTVTVNNLQFQCRTGGLKNTGDGVILLHGFPETSHMWIDLIPLMVSEGYRVVAPDQRGYNPGSLPKKKSDFLIDKLCDDIFQIADKFEFDRFHLVGHDWGSSVGWAMLTIDTKRILSWSALSVPHLKAFMDAYNSDDEQKKKSRYVSFFKLPFLPEFYFSFNNYSNLKSLWYFSSEEQIEVYLQAFSKKRVLKSALNWYRANIGWKSSDIILKTEDVPTPTLLIWGNRDSAIGRTGVEGSEKYMKGPYTFLEMDAGHWLIQESFEEVSDAIIDHIKRNSILTE